MKQYSIKKWKIVIISSLFWNLKFCFFGEATIDNIHSINIKVNEIKSIFNSRNYFKHFTTQTGDYQFHTRVGANFIHVMRAMRGTRELSFEIWISIGEVRNSPVSSRWRIMISRVKRKFFILLFTDAKVAN